MPRSRSPITGALRAPAGSVLQVLDLTAPPEDVLAQLDEHHVDQGERLAIARRLEDHAAAIRDSARGAP